MNIAIYQVDAFTTKIFQGNPAAVCPLEFWLPDQVMQDIAAENNLSETAFFVAVDNHFELRWFTPQKEIDLCGHATLAAAFVISNYIDPARKLVKFISPRSGELAVAREKELFVMDFPSRPPSRCEPPEGLVRGLGARPLEVWQADDYLAVFATEAEILALRPDMQMLGRLDKRGVIVTARGDEVDFVSRFFAPKYGVDEDPVTGSSHCTLTPFWQGRLAKNSFVARQLSARGGELLCEDCGERVFLSGKAVIYLRGTITI